MDIHRVAAEAVSLHEGNFKKLGRVPMLREALEGFARRELTLAVSKRSASSDWGHVIQFFPRA